MFDLTPYKLIVFDADGTLRSCTVPGQPCPNRAGEWQLIPGVQKRFGEIEWSNRHVAIVSNQAGIALGYMSEADAFSMLNETLSSALELAPSTPLTRAIYWCPHLPNAACPCRKPSPFLLLRSAFRLVEEKGTFVRLDQMLYVGDQQSDREAAARAGIAFAWPHDFFGWEKP